MSLKPIDRFPPGTKCILCSFNEDEASLGSIYKLRCIYVHYFCLLLSNGIKQNGRDSQGILGFLSNDIKEEAKRGEQEVCSYCKRKGATIVCAHTSCPIKFHLPCGTKRGSMHLFFGNFHSYCSKHRKNQEIPSKELERLNSIKPECPICAEDIELKDKTKFIWPSCCKSVPYHRLCLQKYANEAGLYHFKCSLCQDRDIFKKLCVDLGIFIPERDASWELEPRAFEALQQVYFCNAEVCKCPKGRTYNHSRTKWANIKCTFCHATGTHLDCSSTEIHEPESWICKDCEEISNRLPKYRENEKCKPTNTKEIRKPLPSTSIVKTSVNIYTGGSSSQASVNDIDDRIPKVVLKKFVFDASTFPLTSPKSSRSNSIDSSASSREVSPNPSKPSISNPFLDSQASTSENLLRAPSVDSLPDSPSGLEKPADALLLKTNVPDKEINDLKLTVINEANESSSKNAEVAAMDDEVIMIDSDEELTSATMSEAQSTPSAVETLSSFGALNKEESFAHQFEDRNETFLVYRTEIIISSESDDDVVIVENNLPVETNPKKMKFFKNRRSTKIPSKIKTSACPPIDSDPEEVIIGFNEFKANLKASSKQKFGHINESVSPNSNNVPSNQTKKPSSVNEIGRLPGTSNTWNEKFSQDIRTHQSKPSVAIKPMCFNLNEQSVPASSEPLLKRTKIDVKDSSSKVFLHKSTYFPNKIEQPRITAYFDEMEPPVDYLLQDYRDYTLTQETAEIFTDYINSIVGGSFITVIYDPPGVKFCRLLSQYYKKLPVNFDPKPVSFDSTIFQRLRNYSREPSTVFLIATDISYISDDYIDRVEEFLNESFTFKIVLTTLPKNQTTKTFNFKLRLTNNFNRYLIEMCRKKSIDIWDLNKVEFLKTSQQN